MVSEPFTLAPLLVLAALLLYAAASDIRTRTVDNWVSIAMALAAPAWWWLAGWGGGAMAWQLGFAAVVFAVLFGLWSAGLLGGADVKLIAALALWLPPGQRMGTFFVIALAGAAVSIAAFVAARQARRRAPHSSAAARSPVEVPYAVAIAVGGAAFLLRTVN